MVPPPPQQQSKKQRTQSAADALLLVTRPNKTTKSKTNAAAIGTTRARKRPRSSITSNVVRNPYNRSTTSIITNPLNDNNTNNNRSASGVANSTAAAAQKTFQTNNGRTSSHAPTAFQRRNARDRGTKHPPPPTGTDKALVALLDGPAKKQKRRRKQSVESGHSMTSSSSASSLKKQQSEMIAAPPSTSTKTTQSKRSKVVTNSSSCITMKPPPMPSYYSTTKQHPHKTNNRAHSSTNSTRAIKPRKRVSSHMKNQLSSSISKNESGWMAERKAVIGDAFADSFGNDIDGNIAKDDGASVDVEMNHNNYDDGDDNDMVALLDAVEKNDGALSIRKAVDDVHLSNHNDDSLTSSYAQVPATYANNEPKIDDAKYDNATLTTRVEGKLGGDRVPIIRKKDTSEASLVEVSSDTRPTSQEMEEEGLEKNDASKVVTTSDFLEEPLVKSNINNDENEELDFVLDRNNKSKITHAEWYDPDEHAEMDKEAELNAKTMKETKEQTKQTRKKQSSKHGINDNFVRLDLRNAAGSCRGARNLKKVNKQKLWRAQHRFGMNDRNNGSGDEEANPSFGIGGKYGYNNKGRNGGGGKKDGGDVKCFSSASNAGVDPLDDFMDGVFASKKTSNDKKAPASQRKSTVPKRNSDVPMCTRHQRPCKLLTVKKNTKGNKGRKFYVCPMPKGEQCDFFKWEEDTIEATQRALLKSSSSSGFIARQVAASRIRFKELTVPELRNEAKRRGLKGTGTKDQLLTRLLIWVRDEIAESVENDGPDISVPASTDPAGDDDSMGGESEEDCETDSDEEIEVSLPNETANASSKMIELGDGDDDESSSDDDELEVCHAVDDKPVSTEKRSTKFDPQSSPLRKSLKHYFGYSYFREGQEWAINRCLSHKRSLLVAPTGQGKSLCYALPAAVSDGLCLVVSPLISLMQDQLRQLPPKIPAATLSGSMTSAQMALIVDDVLRGRLKVLFVSPERLASAAFRRLMRPKFNLETRQYERQFPEVSLLCVDEAHCLSQWGHNFRPSYLRVRSLMSLIQPKSVLALTATAGPMVVKDICNTLCIPFDGQCTTIDDEIPSSLDSTSNGVGVKALNCNRDNIDVFSLVLQDLDERRYLVHKLLKEKKVDDSDRRQSKKLPIEEGCLSRGSVIVYVWRQKDTEIVAEQLNGAGVLGGVVCYHGGMNANDRSKAQSKFLRGKARICVATVAFGLGINKADIEGVIHLCLPPSPEHYLQEIGRAGRDGRPAKAIALPLIDEFVSRHSLAHSDRLSNSQLSTVFCTLQNLVDEAVNDIPPEAGVDLTCNEANIDNLHVAIPVAQTVEASDCKEESIETMLSLLEEENSSHSSLLSVEGYLPDTATITLKRCALDKLSKVEEVARSIEKCGIRFDQSDPKGDVGGTALEKGFYAYSFGTYRFSVVRCARCMGPTSEPRHVYAALRRLQDRGELELSLDVTANGRALHIRMKKDGINMFRTGPNGNSDGVSIEGMKTMMSKQFSAKEQISVSKVQSMYDIAQKVANITRQSNGEEFVEDAYGNEEKSARLVEFQNLIQAFFKEGTVSSSTAGSQEVESHGNDDIKDFPFDNTRLLSCLSSDTILITQALSSRRQRQDDQGADAVVQIRQHADYRNLCIAKILHGIDAPRAPIREWYSHMLWGKYRSYSFTSILRAVEKVFEES